MCCLGVLAVSRPAWGAQAPHLKPGARVRLDAPSLGGRLTGTLVAVDPDTLSLKLDGQAEGLNLIVLTDSVTSLEVRRERAMTLEGLGLGLLAGTLLAAAADPNWLDENGNCTTASCLAYKVSPRFETRFAVLGSIGALLGIIVGSEEKKVSWAPVPLVGPAPGGGLALGLRLSF